MSIVHKATLTPPKDELFAAWIAARPWASSLGAVGDRIGSYRFDDPAGRVGIECTLVPVGRTVVHIPLTYRDAPLDGAEDYLVTTAEHSVLGKRWVYDACADPVAVKVLLGAALSGASQAPMDVYENGRIVERRPAVVTARGTGNWPAARTPHRVDGVTIRRLGAEALLEAAGWSITVKRVVDGAPAVGDAAGIEVTWPDGSGRLVGVRRL